jgi:hypothetical protein
MLTTSRLLIALFMAISIGTAVLGVIILIRAVRIRLLPPALAAISMILIGASFFTSLFVTVMNAGRSALLETNAICLLVLIAAAVLASTLRHRRK